MAKHRDPHAQTVLAEEPEPQTINPGDIKGFTEEEPIDEFNDLNQKIQALQFEDNGQNHLFITERLFKLISKRSKATNKSITFGDPGIRLYVPGVKKELDRIERMNAEDYGNYLGKKANEANRI